MEIRALDGLSMALVDAREAVTTDWGAFRGRVDVARVSMPSRRRRAELAEAGFLTKPARLTWIAATLESEESFLAQLSFRDRKNVRIAQLRAAADRVRFEIVQPVGPGLLDKFLALYGAQVAGMRNGVAIAAEHAEVITDESARYYAVAAYVDGELVGGCIAQECPAEKLVRLRFAATDQPRHSSGLARALYLSAVDAARQLGYPQATLGTDPNLYGHLVKAGLFAFKWRLGFTAVPSQSVVAGDGFDEADLIIGAKQLIEPVLFLSYLCDGQPASGGASQELRAELYSIQADLDTRPYQATFLSEVRRHVLPGVRRTTREDLTSA